MQLIIQWNRLIEKKKWIKLYRKRKLISQENMIKLLYKGKTRSPWKLLMSFLEKLIFFFQKEMQLQNKIKKKFDIKIKYHSKICLIFFQGYHYATKTRITRHKRH